MIKYDFLKKLKKSLEKTRKKLNNNIIKLFQNKNIDSSILEKIEDQLLISDISVQTTKKIINVLKKNINSHNSINSVNLYNTLQNEILKILRYAEQPLIIKKKKPYVILIVGVNGVGKTTAIGKLTNLYHKNNKKVILAAADTFRFGAIEQLKILGKISGCISTISHHIGSDPSAVVFDSIQQAKKNNADILIVDTAGRLQNKSKLMEELKKITQVMKKIDINFPHETMIIIDASIGQNSINQIKLFNKIIKITGIFVTKLDGSAKGGAVLSIADHFAIPIRYIGIGQNIEDIQTFQAKYFSESIFKIENLPTNK